MLNPLELIEASCRWYLDMKDTTQGTAAKFISHIAFIASKAKSYKFQDVAHMLYDMVVRKLAVTDGYEAFSVI